MCILQSLWYDLGAHSSKSAVQRENLVKKNLDQIMRERRVREGARQAKWLQGFW